MFNQMIHLEKQINLKISNHSVSFHRIKRQISNRNGETSIFLTSQIQKQLHLQHLHRLNSHQNKPRVNYL